MIVLFHLIKRNTLMYLRDKASVFFSFLSVIIIILMYVLFLGKMQSDNLLSAFGNIEGIDWLVSSWIMAGIVTVSTVTVPLGSLATLINDRYQGKINDFYSSPINRNILALSYLMSSWVIAFFMVMLNMVLGQIYVLMNGGELFTLLQLFKMVGLILVSIMSFSSFFFFISMYMRTPNSFGLLSTLVGTFVGFLGGIYIPIGVLGNTVQSVMNVFPTAHSVTLIRRVYMEGAISKVFDGATQEAYDSYANIYGLNVYVGNHEFTSFEMFLSLFLFGAVFYILSVWKLSKSKL